MQWNPLPCNRLDRLTSGIMFIGKNAAAAEKMSVEIKTRTVEKEYIARVIGEFPEGDIVCDQPVMQISPKLGLNRARASGKSARTVFKRLAYHPPNALPTQDETANPAPPDPASSEQQKFLESSRPWTTKRGFSIVRCLPLTGRTHQLRVHLQYLGHPIANDPIYCNQRVFGPELAVGDSLSDDDAQIITRLSRMGKSEAADTVAYYRELVDEYEERKAEKMTGQLCEVCQTPLYSDPGPQELGIYLHAKRYASGDGTWAYETELPEWALSPGEGEEGAKERQDGIPSGCSAAGAGGAGA